MYGAVEGAKLDQLIARQTEVFAERGERFEWKLHGHDRPGDLARRLRAAGFVPEETETILIAPVAEIAVGEMRLPEGVSLREVTSRSDFERIAALEQAVWGDEDQQGRGPVHAEGLREIGIVPSRKELGHMPEVT